MQKAFIFDINRCTGCAACQVACSIENRVDPGISWRRIHTFNPRHVPGVPTFHHSVACNHCVDPPCLKHCPALAFSKDARTGAVTIDAGKCIGCRYCSWACPYDAPRFSVSSGTMEKCTFCTHRLDEGMDPACVSMCPTNALKFGDHSPLDVPAVPGFTPTEIGPAIRFVPLRDRRKEGAATQAIHNGMVSEAPVPAAAGRIGFRSEWTLWAFSSLAALLVGLGVSVLVFESEAAPKSPGGTDLLLVLLLAGAAGMALSTTHLGRRHRAWRAVLNWRRSWLSREVLLFGAFLAMTGLCLVVDPFGPGSAAGWVTAALGLAALIAMDSVYHVTRAPGLWLHSAQVFLTGLLYQNARHPL